MSDRPLGPGWWEASDGRWYAPELHPDRQAPPSGPDPSTSPGDGGPDGLGFAPPTADQWISDGPEPPVAPASGAGAGSEPAAPSAPSTVTSSGPAPSGRSGRWSTGRIVAVVFGGGFLVLAVGCGALAWALREEIGDALVDFTDAVASDAPASCEVVGVAGGGTYEIEATLTASDASEASHYRAGLVLRGNSGTLGRVDAVLRSVEPDETRTESVFNAIVAEDPVAVVTCSVEAVDRVPAGAP